MNHLLTESLVCSHRCQVSWHLDNPDPLRLNREQASEAEIQAEGDMAVDGGSSGEPQVKGAGGGGSFKDWYMEQYVSSFDDDLDEIRKQPDFATGDVSRLITAIKSGADVRLLRCLRKPRTGLVPIVVAANQMTMPLRCFIWTCGIRFMRAPPLVVGVARFGSSAHKRADNH